MRDGQIRPLITSSLPYPSPSTKHRPPMSPDTPPPLPDFAQLRKKLHIWRRAYWAGAILAAGPGWGLLGMGLGMLATFGAMEGDVAKSATQITTGIHFAIISRMVGFASCPVGVALLLVARRKTEALARQCAAIERARAEPVDARR